MDHDGQNVLTPNQELLTLDAAHASKRFLSRTFKCDENIDAWLNAFVLGKKSIVQVIENSHVFIAWFKGAVASLGQDDAIAGDVFNLGMAKHRFISIKKRLGRLIGKYLAVFSVAEKIRVARPGKPESEVAVRFLQDFGPEQFLQLAMLADAADESYVYTMFADDEEMDLALQADEVAVFLDHVRYLFNEGACFSVEGHTKFAIQQLKKVRILNIGKDPTAQQ